MVTSAQDILDAIEATILKLASGANQAINFNGQQVTKKDLKALREERAYWKAEVLRKNAAVIPNANSGGRIPIRFVSSRVCPILPP